MSVGTALRRLVGLEAKSRALSVVDGRDAPLWSRLLGYRAAAVPVGRAVTLPLGFENLIQPFRVWS